MRSRHRLTALALVGALGTIAAGGELSKKDFVAAANTVCKGTNDYLTQIALAISSSTPTEEQRATFVESLVPAYRDLSERIEELAEPRADRKKIRKMLATLDREIDAVEDDPAQVGRPTGPFPKFEKLAKKYGLSDCAPA